MDQDVMSDDNFAESSNPNCMDLSVLGTNEGGNEVVYQLIKVTSVKTKPREILTMRARRREGQAASPKTHSSRSRNHDRDPAGHVQS